MPLVSLSEAVFGLGAGDPNQSIAGTQASGPGGIESVIEYNGLFLNMRQWVDTFLVTQINGLDDADVRDTRDPNPGRHGETPGIALYGGRTIVLQGKIMTRTLWKLRDMHQAMRAAFVDIDNEYPLIFHGPTPDSDLMIYCKKSQKLESPEQQTTLNHFERAFSITLRASDPRFLSVNNRYNTWIATAATQNAVVFNAVNNGNFNADPIIQLTGPMAGVSVINEYNGDLIQFTTNIPSGETWVVDMTKPKIYRLSDGADRYQYVSTTSTEFQYVPGVLNPITVVATGLTVGTSGITSVVRDTLM